MKKEKQLRKNRINWLVQVNKLKNPIKKKLKDLIIQPRKKQGKCDSIWRDGIEQPPCALIHLKKDDKEEAYSCMNATQWTFKL